ncbi:MAG: peptidase domain-containing ABC transporter [Bacteroidota bacterium]|nr:peptidase domain-containing ABC transporter [Bacteroidota bacterium]
MNIKIKQHDITDCGAACLASVAAYYKLKLPLARIRQIAGTDKKGTNLFGLLKAAEQIGFQAKGVQGNPESLSTIPTPAIAHVIINQKLEHYIVIYSVGKNVVKYMDPADGQMHKSSFSEFEKIWSGILLLLIPDEDFETGNQRISNLTRFIHLLKPHKSILYQAIIGAMAYTIIGLSSAIYIQKITDNVMINGNINLLNLLSCAMLVILVVQLFVGATKSIFMLQMGQKIDAQLILGYYKHLLKLPQHFFDTMRVGEIISRVNDAVKIRAFINETVVGMVVNLFIVAFSFLLMFIYSGKLALIMSAIIPFYLFLYWLTNRLNKKQERKLMENSAELESQLVESITSVKTIKQFGIENFANIKTEMRFVTLLDTVYKSGMNSVFSTFSSEFLTRAFTIIILWAGTYLVLDKTITPGELLSFYALIGYFTNPMRSLIDMNKNTQNAMIAADRLFDIMDLEREEETDKSDLKREYVGDIRFEDVSFSYGTRTDVFEQFSFTIPKGKLTAIIGESGSGKTTLAALLQKLYPIKSGKIYIGDHNIDFYTNSSLRQLISSVPQQLDLFSGSIIENIAVGEFNPDIERIINLCKELGMINFIEKLPNGLASQIGENGATLSGGQRQRLAIARALYKDPEILILDEATSALDSESEFYVQKMIQQMVREGKTVIVIAHRLSTVVKADKIAVMYEGSIIEEGTHRELFNLQGSYYKMWQKQIPSELFDQIFA